MPIMWTEIFTKFNPLKNSIMAEMPNFNALPARPVPQPGEFWTQEHQWLADLLQVNRILLTKDGRKIGNALITSRAAIEGKVAIIPVWTVKSDYGNEIAMFAHEIVERFYFGEIALPDHKHYVPPAPFFAT